MRVSREAMAAVLALMFSGLFHAANAQSADCPDIEKPNPRLKTARFTPLGDSLEADMMGLLSGAEQNKASAIRGEYFVPGSPGAEAKEIGTEDRKKLEARLTGTSFKLKLGETRTWGNILETFGHEIGKYLATKKKYRILKDSNSAPGKIDRTVSAALRLIDTVYVWTPGCNCPKPKSSALATCAVILVAEAVDGEKMQVWQKRELLFYIGLEGSLEDAVSPKRIRKYVRNAFRSFK